MEESIEKFLHAYFSSDAFRRKYIFAISDIDCENIHI